MGQNNERYLKFGVKLKNKKDFEKNGYCIVKRALYPDICGIATRYAFYDERANFKDDSMVSQAHSKYSDFLMESLLVHMQSKIEKNTGIELYPTFSYYRVYRPGNILESHTDRDSCEISVSLCLGYNLKPWPIFIGDDEVNLKPGDMVIYRGNKIEHRREIFDAPEGAYQVQATFHYVDRFGPYAGQIYDKREDLAMPWNGR
jgi:hypothetical protein